jgi:hypothetical protein
VLANVNVIFGFMLSSAVCIVELIRYSSLVELYCKPNAAAKLSHIAVGRYIYGTVESMYIEIELDIKVVVVEEVARTPVGV